MSCCEISDRAEMSKAIIVVRYFGLGGRESLETAVRTKQYYWIPIIANKRSLKDCDKCELRFSVQLKSNSHMICNVLLTDKGQRPSTATYGNCEARNAQIGGTLLQACCLAVI